LKNSNIYEKTKQGLGEKKDSKHEKELKMKIKKMRKMKNKKEKTFRISCLMERDWCLIYADKMYDK